MIALNIYKKFHYSISIATVDNWMSCNCLDFTQLSDPPLTIVALESLFNTQSKHNPFPS